MPGGGLVPVRVHESIAHKPNILPLIVERCSAEGEELGNGVDDGDHCTPLPHHEERLECEEAPHLSRERTYLAGVPGNGPLPPHRPSDQVRPVERSPHPLDARLYAGIFPWSPPWPYRG